MPANRKSALAERAFNKPYYLLRPSQVVRRVRRLGGATPDGLATAPVPWGELDVFPRDEMGSDIWRKGVFELAVSETIARLLDPGELAVDAGANVGYMTCLMASRVGRRGKVIAYEPHPDLHRVLSANVARVRGARDVSLVQAALSDRARQGRLTVDPDFARNMGTCALAPEGAGDAGLSVPVERLDDRLSDGSRVGLLKLDVEGHELSVLRGARRALSQRRIRDVVFEENAPVPTPVTELLQAAGYVIFGLDQRLLGPRLLAPGELRATPLWEAPTYLATLDVGRARSRMRRRGWTVLRPQPKETARVLRRHAR